ncbi:hypothetical protein [Flavobacterium suncheonense]|uniref:Uncharacterized protein n=1 Tax=Flavobacterium suncheonense GH29-5 = DSM 17707 TaxID=1121899 RepID=A0A0A2MG38_9FLAO|nr:hypothetical protein [Flavobacterium suncheonense]KGO90433.1 hypothetical protein Q764_02450 [Flavobacterium suncheonense GH29-5 = DSM 17707]
MEKIHSNYNLMFTDINIKSNVDKGVVLINSSDEKYIDLMYFLIQLQHKENVYDYIIPEINEVLQNEKKSNYVCSETVCATIFEEVTKLEWENRVTSIPTKDFKSILMEYAEFYW